MCFWSGTGNRDRERMRKSVFAGCWLISLASGFLFISLSSTYYWYEMQMAHLNMYSFRGPCLSLQSWVISSPLPLLHNHLNEKVGHSAPPKTDPLWAATSSPFFSSFRLLSFFHLRRNVNTQVFPFIHEDDAEWGWEGIIHPCFNAEFWGLHVDQ